MELEIVYLNPCELKPYENNTRKHTPEDIDQIKESIQKDGFNDPIGIWGKDNLIVEGHGRQIAAMEMGIDRVPCIRLDHMTDTQRRDYAIRHNRTAELSGWDFGKLEEEVAALEIDGVDLSGLKFDIDALNLGGNPEINIVEDEPPESPETPITKLGDIYQLGQHRLICGDSTDPAVIDRLMDGVKAKLLLTDPPYGVKAVESGGHNDGKKAGKQMCRDNVYMPVIGDDTTDTARANYDVALTCTENQIIFGGNYFTDFLPPSRCWIVWDKKVAGSFADGELAWTSFDRNLKIYEFMWSGMRRQGDRTVEGKTRVHPTQKPVGMLADILKDFSEENDSILDCFGGSGSTLIACEQLNRKCYMCELDPHYCDVIIERWENLTGEKAVLLNA
jgi:hypothetical protein